MVPSSKGNSMKRIIYSLLLTMVALPAVAQLDRSVRPQPGEAREPEIAEYKKYELDNGITLIVVEDHKLPRLSIQLSLDIDPIVEGDKAGMISLAGDLLGEGTANRTKEVLDESVDFMGARLSTYSSGAFASGLSKYSEDLMELLADVVLHPSFPQESFDKLKQQSISGIRANQDDPGAMMSNLYGSQIYGLDHAFGEIVTESTIENVTLEDCVNYWSTYFKPNVAYITIVGDIKPRAAKKLVNEYFEGWTPGEVPTHSVPVPELPSADYVALINRPASVQSEIRIGNRVVLSVGDEDLEAARIANMILGGGSLARLYLNLREDKGYTYGAYSSIGTSEHVTAFTANGAVRTEVTDSAITQFLFEIDRIRTTLVTEEELQGAKNYLAGSFGRSLESPETVARFAYNIERYGLDEDYYNDYLQRLQAVTAEDVQKAAQKYFADGNLLIAVVGKASDIKPSLAQFGEVKMFDAFGQPASDAEMIPEGLTVDAVLNSYVEALGGAEALAGVKSYSMQSSGSIMGQTLSIGEKWMKGGMYRSDIQSPMGAQSMVLNGSDVKVIANGSEQPIPEEAKAEILADDPIFMFRDFSNFEGVLSNEVAVINGVNAYAVSEGETTYYFAVESGLLIRESSTEEGPQGSVTSNQDYSNFKEVNGIVFPHAYTFPLGGSMTIDMSVSEIKVNSGVSASDF
ncbi:MAG: insulinase family protein [Bacteroidetes bacterium]|nr:MAG: insulinase family protein [Bacteroidota bacterium]